VEEYYIPGVYETIWFFAGAIIFNFLGKLLNVIKAHEMIKISILQCLFLLSSINKDIELIMNIKHDLLRVLQELDEEAMKAAKSTDDQFLADWKLGCVLKIRETFPRIFSSKILEFNDWDEAMVCLRDFKITREK
jgi:hypothetical protein